MPQLTVTRPIAVPIHQLWDVLSDFGGVQHFHPFVEKSPLLNSTLRGLGAKRRCDFYDKTSVTEEIIDWQDGKNFTVELSEGSMPLQHAQAKFSLTSLKNDLTEVSIKMNYTVKYGLMGMIMNKLLMKKMMDKMLSEVLVGLEHHIKTGEIVGKNGVPESNT